jgi:2-(1,2-epoxy-1,2-dihydrophenyl)acetyl-CoA isomerase
MSAHTSAGIDGDVSEIVIDAHDPIGIVRLNRPRRGNSVTPEVVTAMGEAVRELGETDSVRAVVLTGTGSVFCAGADVQDMYSVYRDDGADGLMDYLGQTWMPAVQRTVRMLWATPKPLVAAFNGAATAGGLDFGLTCDMRVAATTARFAESYVNLGMVPVAGGIYLLPRLIGQSAAMELLASGRIIDAARAQELRLVDDVCEPGDLMANATALAERLTAGPDATFAALKRVARQTAGPELDATLRASLQANIDLIARDDVRSRILAVMEQFSLRADAAR